MRQEEPVWRDKRSGVWAIACYHDLRSISGNTRGFSNARGIRPELNDSGDTMMAHMDPPRDTARRRVLQPKFTPSNIARLESSISTLCHGLIDRICEGGECDIVAEFAAQLPLQVIGELMGFPVSEHPQLLEWSDTLIARGATDLATGNHSAMEEAAAGFAL